jgi:hypothetical protein
MFSHIRHVATLLRSRRKIMKVQAFHINEPVPELNAPHALAVIQPFMDVSKVGSMTLSCLESSLASQELARLALPGNFFDLTRYRPAVFRKESNSEIDIPNAIINYGRRSGDHDFLFLRLSDSYNDVDVIIPYHISDEEYLAKIKEEFIPRAESFKPEYIFWEYGYDATQGEYGDKGLTRDCHPKLAQIIKTLADSVCQGRLVVVLCSGSGRGIAAYIMPRIISCLADTASIPEEAK